MNSLSRYTAVLGRAIFTERTGNQIKAYGFPPLARSFWKSLFAELHNTHVYITAGLSEHAMPVPAELAKAYPPRVELMATCDVRVTGGADGTEDVVTALLLGIAEQVVSAGIFIGVGHTLDFQAKLYPNTEMSAFLFTPPIGPDQKRLRKCTKADAILNVVPITAAELALLREKGVGALIDLFGRSNVRPVFDLARKSAV